MNNILPKAVGYLAFGDLYLSMAMYSLQTLRRHDRSIPVFVFTNKNVDLSGLSFWDPNVDNLVLINDETSNNRFYKVSFDSLIDADKVCFLDCDTIVMSRIDKAWDYLDYFDIALKLNTSAQKAAGKGNVYILDDKFKVSEIPHFNSGVIFFRKNVVTQDFFRTWSDLFQKLNVPFDQVSLIESLFCSRVRVLPLTQEWNYFPDLNFFKKQSPRPIIMHYTNRISEVIERNLLSIGSEIGLSPKNLKHQINKKRQMRRRKIGSLNWFKLRFYWLFNYKKENSFYHQS